MICIIALVVFGIIGIFSARYRTYAKEAFSCVFRRITLRPCTTGFDQKMKMKITGKLMKKSPRAAGFVYKHFEIISWTFTIIFIATTIYTAYSGYNYYIYGNCYGPESDGGICPYAVFEETYSPTNLSYTGPPVMPDIGNAIIIGPENATVTIIEFGCYVCPYTARAEPIVKDILNEYDGKIRYAFRNFPVHRSADAELHAEAALCAREQGKFWEYHDLIFTNQNLCSNMTSSNMKAALIENAIQLDMDKEQFVQCLNSGKYKTEVAADLQAGISAGVRGTPTFFINNRTIVGDKPLAAFKAIINDELNKH
ncbi:MAG: DsbA family protein [Candidatus Aenigmarchaeota archaeon]|nr:DsbA family protein [Candidatus Aenigmarchaeota archaeon]